MCTKPFIVIFYFKKVSFGVFFSFILTAIHKEIIGQLFLNQMYLIGNNFH